jgi:diguanylate cyclase (GGDEF)-like protein
MTVYDYLRKVPAYLIIAVAAALIALIGWLDFVTGTELSLDIFMLIPIFLVAWFVDWRTGSILSIFGAIVWWFANSPTRATFATPLFFDINVLERLAFFLLIVFLVSSLRTAFDYVEKLSRTDSLTELLNSRTFYGEARSELERARRFGHPLTVAFLDVDDFKLINDENGHAAGDDILRAIGAVIKRNVRGLDLAGRLGGDEFAILLAETGETQAREAIARLMTELNEVIAESGYTVTFSGGVVTPPELPETVDDIIKRADKAMYAVKRSGKNTVVYET